MADHGRSYRIVEPDRFARVMARVVRRAGTQTKAAASLGISQPTLNRLLHAPPKRISEKRFYRLNRLVPRHLIPPLWRAILTPAAAVLINKQQEWEADALGAFGWRTYAQHGTAPFHAITGERLPQVSEAEEKRARAIWSLLEHLYANPVLQRRFHQFEEWLVSRGHGSEPVRRNWRLPQTAPKPERAAMPEAYFLQFFMKPRGLLALFRVAEPLLPAWSDDAPLERREAELSSTGNDLVDLIRLGIRREMIVLKRDADLQRAQTLSVVR